MKNYKITINISEVGGVYSAKNMEEAEQIAQEECNDIYARLRGRCKVEVENVEEINDN